MQLSFFYLVPILALLAACQPSTQQEKNSTESAPQMLTVNAPEALEHPGHLVVQQNCIACHSAAGGENNRVAPPFFAIQKHYRTDGISQEAFVASMVDFLRDPTMEKSKMPGAIRKFGVMPYVPLEEQQLQDVAEYLYLFEAEKPEWFDEHYQREHGGDGKGHGHGKGNKHAQGGDGQGQQKWLAKGKQLALATKAVLGQNLMKAISEKGPEGAVEFCNTRAIHLTDSMAAELNASIKRVSDQPRNPNNSASEHERTIIELYKSSMAEGNEIKPVLEGQNGKMVGYYPITTNAMCLKCHGTPNEQVNAPTLAKLSELYPNDQATGYAENELRGIWVVEMVKGNQ